MSAGVVLAAKVHRDGALKLAPATIMVVVANTQMGLLWTEEAQGFHAEPHWFVGQSVLMREKILLQEADRCSAPPQSLKGKLDQHSNAWVGGT